MYKDSAWLKVTYLEFSLLIQVGGFGLPFYVIGGLILLNGALMFVFLPEMEGEWLFEERDATGGANINRAFEFLRFFVPPSV